MNRTLVGEPIRTAGDSTFRAAAAFAVLAFGNLASVTRFAGQSSRQPFGTRQVRKPAQR